MLSWQALVVPMNNEDRFGFEGTLVKQPVSICRLEVDTTVRWSKKDGLTKSMLSFVLGRSMEHLP